VSGTARAAPPQRTAVRATIDLNADVGEGFDDAALFPYLTSASVACGGHAGDDDVIRRTLEAARARSVAVGAHPGFADRASFGRRVATRDPAAIAGLVREQVEHLVQLAAEAGVRVSFVKPHGALYNLAAEDDGVAAAIAGAVRGALPGVPLVLLAGSRALAVASREGVRAVAEGFVDRALLASGALAPRDRPGACLSDPEEAARRAVAIACHGRAPTVDGGTIAIAAETLCLHGDGPAALAIARTTHERLAAAGIAVAPFVEGT